MPQEIKATYSESTFNHQPQLEIAGGEKEPHQDIVSRSQTILTNLRKSGFVNVQAKLVDGMPWITKAHAADYINFLDRSSKESSETGHPIYPSVHPYWKHPRASNTMAERGKYMFDTHTPIDEHTFSVAYDSASCAIAAAELVLQGEQVAYALTRPPGHHAEHTMAGGYCYINNAAVAAEYFLDKGASKVAIFDIDAHHGNGTQNTFYDRGDVFVANIHTSPRHSFPYFSGYAEEIGDGEGTDCNLNLPLPPNIDDDTYQECVKAAIKDIKVYDPDYLIISAGLNTHAEDPTSTFNLSTDYFKTLGRTFASMGVPILVVQEGGSATPALGENVVSLLKGLAE